MSDDNPFSEAQFKTLKYHPGFPGRFHDITAAIAFCRTFFPWYNTEHRHGGIAMLTPDDVHHNRTQSVLGWCRKVGGKLENWRKLLIVKHSERRCAAAERSLRHETSYGIDVAQSIFR